MFFIVLLECRRMLMITIKSSTLRKELQDLVAETAQPALHLSCPGREEAGRLEQKRANRPI